MIRVEITGPQGAGKTRLAEQLRQLLASSGKVVKTFDEARAPIPEEVTRCDVAIIIKQETSHV